MPDRNRPLGGTITFADGDYQFPLNLEADKLEQVLRDQATQYGDDLGTSALPAVRIRRDDCVYDVGYRPDVETRERRAQFIALRDRYGDDMLAYQDLSDVVEQAGLGQYGTDETDEQGGR